MTEAWPGTPDEDHTTQWPGTPEPHGYSALESGVMGAVDTAGFGLGPAISGLTEASGIGPTPGYEGRPEWDPNPARPLVGAARMFNEKVIKPITGGQPDDQISQAYERGRQSALAAINQGKQEHPNAYLAGQLTGALATPGFGAASGATAVGRLGRGALAGGISGGLYGTGEAISQGETPGETALSGGRGALTGAAFGTAGAGALEALRPLGERVANVVRGVRNPDEEASRRVAQHLTADWDRAGPSLSPEELAASNAAGLPRSIIDAGGESTRALARSAANTSPEARAALTEMAHDRFEQQSPRISGFIRNITGAGDATGDLEAIQNAARKANRPAYSTAYAAGDKEIWSPELERLSGAPSVLQAMRAAVSKWKDWQVHDGFGALNPPVKIAPGGVLKFLPSGGLKTFPNLQFWDYAARNIADRAEAARRTGATQEATRLGGLERQLKTELDRIVPEFNQARQGAKSFFGAESALDAGHKFVNWSDNSPKALLKARNAFNKMSAPERELFARGYASNLAAMVERASDNRNVLNAVFLNNGAAQQRTLMALGPQRARQLEALLRAERVVDRARTALGNSTTARQLAEMGLAGGATAGAEGLINQDFNPTHIITAAIGAGLVRRGAQVVDQRVARRVGEMLASNDPAVLARGAQIAARNPTIFNALRQATAGVGRAGTAALQPPEKPQNGYKHGGTVSTMPDWWKKVMARRAEGGPVSDEAQDAAEAAAARVRAPYAKANARESGLPQIGEYFANKLASAVTAPRDALTGAMQVTDPETGMPTPEAMQRGQGVANLAMTGGIPMAQKGALGMFGGMPTYSAAGEAVRGAKAQVMQPSQWLGYLKNQPGVKAQEIEHVGLEDWLKGQQGPVSRESVGEFVQGKQPEIHEIRKGSAGPEYSQALQETQRAFDEFQATTRGTPEADAAFERFNAATEAAEALKPGRSKFESYQLPGGTNYGETLLTLPATLPAKIDEGLSGWNKITSDAQNYRSSHWDEPNVLLHTRHNDRTVPGPNGEPMNSLHLEEIQSDWHQAGRKYGYKDNQPLTTRPAETNQYGTGVHEAVDHTGRVVGRGFSPEEALQAAKGMPSVPDAPFKTTWPDLALKRMLHRAATERNPDGSFKYDAMSWTPGEAQAARYDLSKHVDKIGTNREPDGSYKIEIWPKGRADVPIVETKTAQQLPDYLGKDMAEKIIAHHEPNDTRYFGRKVWEGEGLKVGGEGMKSFYDKMLPDKANALVKKFGVRVEGTHANVPSPEHRVVEGYSGNYNVMRGDEAVSAWAGRARAQKEADALNAAGEKTKREPVHLLRITPALRAAAEKGFPTFARGGYVTLH